MVNVRTVKVSQGEARDGKAPVTAKQSFSNETFQGRSFSVRSFNNGRENRITPPPVRPDMLLMMPHLCKYETDHAVVCPPLTTEKDE